MKTHVTSPMHWVVLGALVALTIGLALLLGAAGTRAEAQIYLGEMCWSILETDNMPGPPRSEPFLLRGGVTHMGGNHYLLQGVASNPEGPGILLATAELLGNEVFIHGTTSGDSTPMFPSRDATWLQARLDLATLNGTYWGLWMTFDTLTRSVRQGYDAGSWTRTSCP